MMRVAFRVDASQVIGTGHVMRCLTLARKLRSDGVSSYFICRDHPGNLIEHIHQQGFGVHVLPFETNCDSNRVRQSHADWLGLGWQKDFEQTKAHVISMAIGWLIVDHYGLDARWEKAILPYCRKIMVIDDLADRKHVCNLLLDQTYGRNVIDYRHLLPSNCRLLCGSKYAMLRPEFGVLRSYSLKRRSRPVLREILITMGGVDRDNVTGQILEALSFCPIAANCRITIVMGAKAPWKDQVQNQAEMMKTPSRVIIDAKDMAQLMADSDLVIGAAGSTAWERCCLGVPTIMVVLADNQRKVAEGLASLGAARLIALDTDLKLNINRLICELAADPLRLLRLSECSASIVDGHGVNQVIQEMEVCGV